MHLHKLKISNFRAIDNIEVEFDTLVSVIIGPNAIGKTTILEAVRLAKSVLAARTQNESNQTLFSLGITSPHMPQRLFPAALTTNANLPTVIKCSFKVEAAEVSTMEQMSPWLSSNLALQSIGLNFSNPAQAMGFLNSPQGQQAVGQAQSQLAARRGCVVVCALPCRRRGDAVADVVVGRASTARDGAVALPVPRHWQRGRGDAVRALATVRCAPPIIRAKVLWRPEVSAGTARPRLLRTSGARKSVVAVTGRQLVR